MKVLENTKEYLLIELADGMKCKLYKQHMRTLYNFLKGYFDFKGE